MRFKRPAAALAMFLTLLLTGSLAGQSVMAPITQASPEQLRRWLKQYPDADANHDGTLSVEEAEAYRQKIVRRQAAKGPHEPEFRHEYSFATMSDGVKIALAVGYPTGFDPADATRKWPAVFTMCGYPSVTVPAPPAGYGDNYVTVQASVRGSGASGGALDPWSPRSVQDGHEVIENWIARQPWSNGKVAIHGYSWPGLVGFLVAGTRPAGLKAVCVGGLVDDFYRGIAYPGGIRNCGFPVDWLNNFYRLDGPFGSWQAAKEARHLSDAEFSAIQASRPQRDLAHDTLWVGMHEPFDGPKLQVQSLCAYAGKIQAPILIGHAWQDEQTGPTGWQLWRRVSPQVPKRLSVTNGHHGSGSISGEDIVTWFDRWLLDKANPEIDDPGRRVKCYFETRQSGKRGPVARGEPLVAGEFPLPDTDWRRYFLRSAGALALSAPAAGETPDKYVVAHDDAGSGGRAGYLLEFPQATAICGPALLTLWATLTTLDTDFYVLLADQAPDGTPFGLQRGLLRASHREVDAKRSVWVDSAAGKLLVQPYHPHTSLQPVTPLEPCQFQIEIPAVGHVFRPGHKLALAITRPPAGDPIGITRSGSPSYRYDSQPPPAVVTILHDAQHPSSLLLPVLPKLPPLGAEPVPLAEQAGLQQVK